MARGSLVADGVRLGPAARLAKFERVSRRRHVEEKGGEEADDEDEDEDEEEEEEEEDSDDDSEIEEARESEILVLHCLYGRFILILCAVPLARSSHARCRSRDELQRVCLAKKISTRRRRGGGRARVVQ